MTDIVDVALTVPGVREWLRSLSDCPPGGVRRGYGLLDAWALHVCEALGFWLGMAVDGDSHQDADEILRGMVDRKIIAPVGKSRPVKGRYIDRGCWCAHTVRIGMDWGFAPAWAYVFESGDELQAVLEREEPCES